MSSQTQPPLFRAAIASSPILPSHRIPEVILYAIFVTSADAVCSRCFTARDALECLRQVDAPAVKKVNVNVSNSGFFGTCFFVPVVDGTLITKRVTELLRLGRVNEVSVFLSFPKIHVLDLGQQEVLVAVTTSAEGTLSVLSRLHNI